MIMGDSTPLRRPVRERRVSAISFIKARETGGSPLVAFFYVPKVIMAYELHLERPNDEKNISGNTITLAEWRAAVGEIENVRLRSGELPVTNPSTGEIILIPFKEGDAQVFFSEEAEWVNVYRWHKRKISFKGSPNFNNQDDLLRQTTRQLANLLNAKIIGDEGEIYE